MWGSLSFSTKIIPGSREDSRWGLLIIFFVLFGRYKIPTDICNINGYSEGRKKFNFLWTNRRTFVRKGKHIDWKQVLWSFSTLSQTDHPADTPTNRPNNGTEGSQGNNTTDNFSTCRKDSLTSTWSRLTRAVDSSPWSLLQSKLGWETLAVDPRAVDWSPWSLPQSKFGWETLAVNPQAIDWSPWSLPLSKLQ